MINMDPTKSRVSVPFFYEPCFEAVVEPAAQLVKKMRAGGVVGGNVGNDTGSGGEGVVQRVRYGSHLESKVLTNFEL